MVKVIISLILFESALLVLLTVKAIILDLIDFLADCRIKPPSYKESLRITIEALASGEKTDD